jgi:prepilin peptidase CpaA
LLSEAIPPFVLAWLLALTAAAALTDTRSGLIPNWLTLPTLALAPLARLAAGGTSGAIDGLAGGLACGLVPLAMFGMRAMGGGDVKLFAALGALCGASLGLELQLVSCTIAASVGLCGAARHGVLRPLLARSLWLLCRRRSPPLVDAPAEGSIATSVRLGAPVFAAALVIAAHGTLVAP